MCPVALWNIVHYENALFEKLLDNNLVWVLEQGTRKLGCILQDSFAWSCLDTVSNTESGFLNTRHRVPILRHSGTYDKGH